MLALLKKYTEIPGPSGYEQRVQNEFTRDLGQYTDEVVNTNVGNVVAHFPGKGRKVAVFGHADEIGWYVLSITDEGFLRLSRGRSDRIGYPYCLVGQKALVIGDSSDVRGCFISTSGHVLNTREREQPLESWNVLVDIGASTKKEVEDLGIHVGSGVIWNPETEAMGKKVFGKAMDDRFTHVVMLSLAELVQDTELSCDLFLASTVQEEVGLKGATDLARQQFDVSIALDVGIAGDYPSLPKGRMPIKLGDGPVLVYRDGSIVYNVDTIKELRGIAEKHGIPYQHGIFENYGSDSSVMMSGGARPNLVATPTRYTHMPIEMMHMEDLENTVKLLFRFVT